MRWKMIKTTAWQTRKPKRGNQTLLNHHVVVSKAGTSRWSVVISSQFMSSFVGNGLMNGPLPPAWKEMKWKLEIKGRPAPPGFSSEKCIRQWNPRTGRNSFFIISSSKQSLTHTHTHVNYLKMKVFIPVFGCVSWYNANMRNDMCYTWYTRIDLSQSKHDTCMYTYEIS